MKCIYMTDGLLEDLDRIIASGVLDHKKVVFFGLNAPAFVCKQAMCEQGIDIFAFVDNNPKAVAQFNNPDITPTFHHLVGDRRITAYLPGELPEEYHADYLFLLYSKYEEEMIAQLETLGYTLNEQVFVVGGFWKTEEKKRAIVPEGAGTALTVEEIKDRQKKMIQYVHDLCQKHGLRYFLHYGTLLGAIRHKGYVPWDDDADISMPYQDMMQLFDIIWVENDRYGVAYPQYNDPMRHFVAKIEDRETVLHQWDIPLESFGGMVLDIFPLSGMPNDEEERAAFYFDTMKHAWEYDDLTVEFPRASAEIQKRRADCKQHVLYNLSAYDYDKSDKVFTVPSKPGHPLIFPRDYWKETISVPFEEYTFLAPAGYDAFLTDFYHDYMTLPPENRRVSNHRFTVFVRQ